MFVKADTIIATEERHVALSVDGHNKCSGAATGLSPRLQ